MIDDCQIPLFLRDKLYADFRKDPDAAFNLVHTSLSKISNPYQGRVESPGFFTDWSVDWREVDDTWVICFTFVDHGHDLPYVVLSQCSIFCNEEASRSFKAAMARGNVHKFIGDVLTMIVADFEKKPLNAKIDDVFEKLVAWKQKGEGKQRFDIVYTYRRMGTDNGMDTIVYLDNNLRRAHAHMKRVTFQPSA